MTPIAQESATTGNKPADQEGQPVAVDNRADSLRALLFLGDLGLYAINIALLIACFSSIPTQTKELDQRGPHALSPAAITADRSCLAYSAQLTAASPSLCTKLSRLPAYPISYLPGQGSLHFLSEELLTTGAPLYLKRVPYAYSYKSSSTLPITNDIAPYNDQNGSSGQVGNRRPPHRKGGPLCV